MAAVAGVRLARASAGQLIELVVSAAGLAAFLAGLIDGLVADEAGVSLLWVCDRICGRTGRSAAIAGPAIATATAPAASASANPARRGVLRQAVMVRIRLLARQEGSRCRGQVARQRPHECDEIVTFLL